MGSDELEQDGFKDELEMRFRAASRDRLNIIAYFDIDSPRVEDREVLKFSEARVGVDVVVVYQGWNSEDLGELIAFGINLLQKFADLLFRLTTF